MYFLQNRNVNVIKTNTFKLLNMIKYYYKVLIYYI